MEFILSRKEEINKVNKCIEVNDYEAMLEWACEHYECIQSQEIMEKVVYCFEECIKQNMPIAALNLGAMYYNGIYLGQNFKKAFELYKIAADAGEVRAICNVGYCYYYGRDIEVDYDKAYEYFLKGALFYDDANCIYKLGDMYNFGKAIEKDEKSAYLLYKKAEECVQANDNNCVADIFFRIGKCKLRGTGTEVNIDEAFEYLQFALTSFYFRRKTDPFVEGLIESTKELIQEIEDIMDGEMV